MNLETPQIGDLPKLKTLAKPNYRGFIARAVGAIVWLVGWSAWARSFNDEFYTTIGDTIYRPIGVWEVSDALYLHEGVHAYQEETLGRFWYYWAYLMRPCKGRLELEAQAYAAEVVAGYRDYEDALKLLTSPTYYPEPWANPSNAEAAYVLSGAVTTWEIEGYGRDKIKQLGHGTERF